jgi:hypothetical protein
MSIDIETEWLLSLSEAAKELPGRPHISTLHRWRLRGVRGVKLDTVLVGGRRFTSREALVRFTDRINSGEAKAVTGHRTVRERERAIERAERELKAAGI